MNWWTYGSADHSGPAIERLVRGGAAVSGLVVHLGVGICGECYEVGPEVFRALGLPPVAARTPVNLREVLTERAQRAGVRTVSASSWCSSHDGQFHSYRRDGAESGRMAAFLGRPLS